MWPWEHLAVGYLLYALGRRAATGEPPTHGAAVALAVATQLPDLVDKPLAWVLAVLPSGTSLAHSLLFAVPLCAVALAVARRYGRPDVGAAFAVGYLSHLLGDGLFFFLTGGGLSADYMLWPLVERPPGNDPLGVVVPRLWESFVAFLGTPRGRLYLGLEVALLGLALALWLWDGTPGLPRPDRRRT